MPKRNRKKAHEDAISRLIYALNHPLRRQILNALMQEPASATMLAEILGVPLSNVSYHLAEVLGKECKAVAVAKRIPRRGAMETVYRLKPSFLLGVIDWPAIPESMRAALRGAALDNFLNAAIASLEADAKPPKDSPRKDNGHYLYRPVSADDDGQREISEAAQEFAEKVAAVEARCSVIDPENLLSLIVGIASFEAAPLPEPDAK